LFLYYVDIVRKERFCRPSLEQFCGGFGRTGCTSGTSQKFFPHIQPGCKAERFVYVLKIIDFHCRRTHSLYNSTRSTSVQGDHFHSVYFAAGMA